VSLTTPDKIRQLQKKLYLKAKQEPDYRFYLLYDKVYREDLLSHAWQLVRKHNGAPGVDGVSCENIEARGDDPQAWWRRAAARHSDDTRPSGANRGQAGAGAHL